MKKEYIAYPLILLAFSGCATMKEHQQSIDRLSQDVAALKASLENTNSKVQDMGNRLVLMQEKVDASKTELDKLSSAQAAAAPAVPPEGLKVVPVTPPEEAPKEAQKETPRYNPGPKQQAHTPEKEAAPETAQDLYNRGQDLFMAGRYDEARDVFSSFLKTYPRHTLSDNALYWIGESYYSEKNYQKALEKFRETADRYPGENKAPDALLKAGYSYLELEDTAGARGIFEKVVARYPGTDAAAKAKKALQETAKKEGKR